MGDEVLTTLKFFLFLRIIFLDFFIWKRIPQKGVSMKKENVIIYNSSFPFIITIYIKSNAFLSYDLLKFTGISLSKCNNSIDNFFCQFIGKI